jgi:hypothetical protein
MDTTGKAYQLKENSIMALLAQCLAEPRKGHLNQEYHIFAYHKAHLCSGIILDDTKPFVLDFTYIYAQEAMQSNKSEP